ncbi:MAG: helix-turn-helix domain-containing protein [Planctomycetota bacterium]|nr:helix-turn-helix domain-containing protein [Planctomycetota bacterium]
MKKAAETSFAATVHKLLNERGWKQGDLATRAELDAGVLSRLLKARREPSLEHCLALARALDMPALEFLALAGLPHLAKELVPVAQFRELERAHLDLLKNASQFEAHNASLEAELKTSQRKTGEAMVQLEQLRATYREHSESAERAKRLEMDNTQLMARVDQLERELRTKASQCRQLEVSLDQANAATMHNYRCSAERDRIIEQLRQQLTRIAGDKAAAGWVGALLGAITMAVIAGVVAGPASERR